MIIELVYDRDCPNVVRARTNLLRAFAQAGVPAKWSGWQRSAPDTPAHARQFGSPAVLVDGQDVAESPPNAAATCRIYPAPDGTPSSVPSVELIAQALLRAAEAAGGAAGTRVRRERLALMPAILLALLPKAACPACWPVYLGLLSAVGLGFLAKTRYLLPLTVVFLVVVLVGLGHRANARRGYGPLLLGTGSASAMLTGKFFLESNLLFYTGLLLLVGASLWNTWPHQDSKPAPCCTGAPGGKQATTRVPES